MNKQELPSLIRRLKSNYIVLNSLYKQGIFENEVGTTEEIRDYNKFHFISPDTLKFKNKFNSPEDKKPRGKKRHDKDLEWATGNMLEFAHFLYENLPTRLSSDLKKELIIYYYRAISLSYEVSDYFLSVSGDFALFLTDLSEEIATDFNKFMSKYAKYFTEGSSEHRELVKQILIVALCGTNQFYREHKYDEGLNLAKAVKKLIDDWATGAVANSKSRGFGLKGLSYYVTGKIHTALGNFNEAEVSFRKSVESYSESIWQKERNFSNEQEQFHLISEKRKNKEITEGEYEKFVEDFAILKRDHELSRGVALRRCGLASSFGYGFQALVVGKVNDAIRLSSISRGIVNWNTGKIYSSYVDLIYFSAKRAENSSDRKALLEIQRNLMNCYRVFQDLIPATHYKNRALFQMALVNHYLARFYKEAALNLPETAPPKTEPRRTKKWNLEKAARFWELAAKQLLITIEDTHLRMNKRLRAESMAILGHALSNSALIEKALGRDGFDRIEEAERILDEAWEEAANHPQIQCEVGLAQAAVGKAKVEYWEVSLERPLDELDERYPQPFDKKMRDKIRNSLNNSRKILHDVLHINQNNNSVRIQATVYLRLTELALFQKAAWAQAHYYYDQFMKISSQIEHNFCHRWARELEVKLTLSKKSYTFTITPGNIFDKNEFQEKLEEYYSIYAVNYAARKIAEDVASGKISNRDSLSSYIASALHENFGIAATTGGKWIIKYRLFEHLRSICYYAKDLPEKAPQARENKKTESSEN